MKYLEMDSVKLKITIKSPIQQYGPFINLKLTNYLFNIYKLFI